MPGAIDLVGRKQPRNVGATAFGVGVEGQRALEREVLVLRDRAPIPLDVGVHAEKVAGRTLVFEQIQKPLVLLLDLGLLRGEVVDGLAQFFELSAKRFDILAEVPRDAPVVGLSAQLVASFVNGRLNVACCHSKKQGLYTSMLQDTPAWARISKALRTCTRGMCGNTDRTWSATSSTGTLREAHMGHCTTAGAQ